jgi:hypothetical protein
MSKGTQARTTDVRFGSKADVTLLNIDVRFAPESGHSSARSGCLLWAKNRHSVVSDRCPLDLQEQTSTNVPSTSVSCQWGYALDHCNALSECSNIQKILQKILLITTGGILIGVAYVSDRCSVLGRQSGQKA